MYCRLQQWEQNNYLNCHKTQIREIVNISRIFLNPPKCVPFCIIWRLNNLMKYFITCFVADTGSSLLMTSIGYCIAWAWETVESLSCSHSFPLFKPSCKSSILGHGNGSWHLERLLLLDRRNDYLRFISEEVGGRGKFLILGKSRLNPPSRRGAWRFPGVWNLVSGAIIVHLLLLNLLLLEGCEERDRTGNLLRVFEIGLNLRSLFATRGRYICYSSSMEIYWLVATCWCISSSASCRLLTATKLALTAVYAARYTTRHLAAGIGSSATYRGRCASSTLDARAVVETRLEDWFLSHAGTRMTGILAFILSVSNLYFRFQTWK